MARTEETDAAGRGVDVPVARRDEKSFAEPLMQDVVEVVGEPGYLYFRRLSLPERGLRDRDTESSCEAVSGYVAEHEIKTAAGPRYEVVEIAADFVGRH